jgi:hypothetical protein
MPNFDGSGPEGKGPMTGRGSGYCVIPLDTAKDEFVYLKNRKRVLENQLNIINSRIAIIESNKSGGN